MKRMILCSPSPGSLESDKTTYRSKRSWIQHVGVMFQAWDHGTHGTPGPFSTNAENRRKAMKLVMQAFNHLVGV